MRFLAALPVLLLVLAAGCGTPRPVTGGTGSSSRVPAPDMADVTLDEPFSLERGSSVVLDGHRLRFDAVYEDSRCPDGTTCVWEGKAVVGLTRTADNRVSEIRLEIPGFVDDEDEPQPSQRTVHGGYTFTLLALDPYPGTPEAEAGDTPVATLVVTRTPSDTPVPDDSSSND